jgi:NTE family protein
MQARSGSVASTRGAIGSVISVAVETTPRFFTKRSLSVVASDTTDESILVLNHRTVPDCPIVWAVRMSMSIPLVWDEVIWQPSWGKYLGRDVAGHAIVDGGLLSNFPIELFISDAPQVTKLMGPKKDNSVLGLLIGEKLPALTGCAPSLSRISTRSFCLNVAAKS